MKAWKLEEIGKIRLYDEVPVPEPEAGEVLVKVKAAGICGSDVPRVYKDGAHSMPLVIGHEFSGQVEKLGTNVENIGAFSVLGQSFRSDTTEAFGKLGTNRKEF